MLVGLFMVLLLHAGAIGLDCGPLRRPTRLRLWLHAVVDCLRADRRVSRHRRDHVLPRHDGRRPIGRVSGERAHRCQLVPRHPAWAGEFQLPYRRPAGTGVGECRRRWTDCALRLASVLRLQWRRAIAVDRPVDDGPAALGNSGSGRRRADRLEPLFVCLELRSASTSNSPRDVPRILCLRLRLVRVRLLAPRLSPTRTSLHTRPNGVSRFRAVRRNVYRDRAVRHRDRSTHCRRLP